MEKKEQKYFGDHGIEGPLVTVHNRNGAPGSDSVRPFYDGRRPIGIIVARLLETGWYGLGKAEFPSAIRGAVSNLDKATRTVVVIGIECGGNNEACRTPGVGGSNRKFKVVGRGGEGEGPTLCLGPVITTSDLIAVDIESVPIVCINNDRARLNQRAARHLIGFAECKGTDGCARCRAAWRNLVIPDPV